MLTIPSEGKWPIIVSKKYKRIGMAHRQNDSSHSQHVRHFTISVPKSLKVQRAIILPLNVQRTIIFSRRRKRVASRRASDSISRTVACWHMCSCRIVKGKQQQPMAHTSPAATAEASQQRQHQPTATATPTATASSSAPCGVHLCAGNPVPFRKVPGQVLPAVNFVKATLEPGDLLAVLSTDGGRA